MTEAKPTLPAVPICLTCWHTLHVEPPMRIGLPTTTPALRCEYCGNPTTARVFTQ